MITDKMIFQAHTYRDLLEVLQQAPDMLLDDPLSIYITSLDEYFSARLSQSQSDDVLSAGHLYLSTKEEV